MPHVCQLAQLIFKIDFLRLDRLLTVRPQLLDAKPTCLSVTNADELANTGQPRQTVTGTYKYRLSAIQKSIAASITREEEKKRISAIWL